MITLTIDKTTIQVAEGTSVLDTAKQAGVDIPTLCRHEDLTPLGTCGMCMVDIDGFKDLQRACITEAVEGMQVQTNTPQLRKLRRGLLELVLATHPDDCLQCIKHGSCELQKLADRFEIRTLRYDKYVRGLPLDRTAAGIVRDMNKCIGCGRCVSVCHEVQSVKAIDFMGRGSDTIISPGYGISMGSSVCVNCGQCIVYCPTGALYEKEMIDEVWAALDNPKKVVVAQVAPAVRVALGEEFDMAPGSLVIGKIYSALRSLGIDYIFDTNFSADLTILEEGTELLERLASGGTLPLITSCSPGWIKFGETYFPELLDHVSTCKSPQQMLGTIIKTYFAETHTIDPENIISLSIMPCTAKKFEAARPEMNDSGYQDVDYVLTTRELARMIRQAGLQFDSMKEEKPDPVLSQYTGAATIFGASGGVMEAAIRSAYELKTQKTLESLDFTDLRGIEGIKKASVDIEGTEIRVAVSNGLSNARTLLNIVVEAKKRGEMPFHFIEIMACRGGCIGGGGQPLENTLAKRAQRIEGLYKEDRNLPIRKSHENAEVLGLYKEFLQKPGSEKSHHLLHTHYTVR
jgi:NADP-reducing hydrogenase subunit HndD